jgi:hypothetical protein
MEGICVCVENFAYVPHIFLISNDYGSTGLSNIGFVTSCARTGVCIFHRAWRVIGVDGAVIGDIWYWWL